MKKQIWTILFFVNIAFVLATAVPYITNLKSEIALLRNVTKMATYYAEEDIPRAANYLDHLNFSGSLLPEEYQPLVRLVSKANALRFFEEARMNLDKGNLARAENSFGLGKMYCKASLNEDCPTWESDLEMKLQSLKKK